MEIRPVDPRDIEWGAEPLAYRVYFWDEDRTSYEYEITQANDVNEVITSASEKAAARTPPAPHCDVTTP